MYAKGANPVPADHVMVAEYLAYRSESVSVSTVRTALVQMISDSGLRRSELVALTRGEIEVQPDGSGRILIPKSKTDQIGDGASIAITGQAFSDLGRVVTAVFYNPNSTT